MIKLVALVFVFVSVSASAQTSTTYYDTSLSTGIFRDKSATVVCNAKFADYTRNETGVLVNTGPTPVLQGYGYGFCEYTKNGTRTSAGQYWLRICSGSTPYLDPAKGCVAAEPPPPPPVCKAGVTGKDTWYRGPSAEGPFVNVPFRGASNGSCEINITNVTKCFLATDGKAYCEYEWSQTGETKMAGQAGTASAGPATPSPTPKPDGRQDVPPQSSPGGCPKGTVSGGVAIDGTPVCIGTGSDPKNSTPPPPKIESSKTEATSDGGTKTTDKTQTKNADGSTTTETKTTTTAADGTKTVTITKDTTAAMNGGAGKDDSRREDDKFDLCKQNPMLNICRNSTVSGSCGEITCMGDAIQCATLRAAAAMQCKQKEDEDALKSSSLNSKGQAAINGADLEGLPSPKTAQKLTIPTIEAQGWLGAGAAFEDVTFVVQGHEITVPLSKWTSYLIGLRYAMMIIASMISFRILGSAILKE